MQPLSAPQATLAASQQQSQSSPPGQWLELLEVMSDEVRACQAEVAAQPLQSLADLFYDHMTADPRACTYLSHQRVQDQLKPSMVRWIRSLLTANADNVETLIAVQRHVGDVHARIGVPLDLVIRGMGILRNHLARIAAGLAYPEHIRADTMRTANLSMDIALEAMTLAYTQADRQSSQRDTAFRLYSLIENASTERERQRALLLDWENSLLYSLASRVEPHELEPLSSSEFGLWFQHKGVPAFGNNNDTERAIVLISEIDDLLTQLSTVVDMRRQAPALLATIRGRAQQLGKLMAAMFDRINELDAGHDPLTNLLNRRFLPTVLRREIELANANGNGFAVIMVDLDHFKRVNDTHGHSGGDQVLQLVASLLNESVRGSDYLFRLGGEEILIVLPAINAEQACTIAEKMRMRIASAMVPLFGHRTGLSASFGVALYDGHPDYAQLLERADAALYQAKREGRNRVVMASQ